MSAELRVDSVGVRLGSAVLLAGATMRVAPGSWTAVVGPNGAGKSTLLRAVLGLVPYTGTIAVDGQSLSRLSPGRRARLIAYAPQAPTLPAGMSVNDYVSLGRTAHLNPLRSPGLADRRVVDGAIERLDLVSFRERGLHTLSGGERQRVVLARALAQQARVLLLDEPTAALDLGHAQQVLELVDELRLSVGLTVVSCLHDLALAAAFADRMVLMAGGVVAADGVPGDVLTTARLAAHYGARATVVTTASGLFIHPLRATTAEREMTVAYEVEPVLEALVPDAPEPTLEEWSDGDHRRPVLLWRAGPGWRGISSGVTGGGIGTIGWWLNAQVDLQYHDPDPQQHAQMIAEELGLAGARGVGMLTAAEVSRVESAEVDGVRVWATVGISVPVMAAGSSGRLGAGRTEAGPLAGGEPGHSVTTSADWRPGTINILIMVPQPLSDAALVNLVITATEAKTQALAEAGVPGTGTASDSICIAARAATLAGVVAQADDGLYGGPRSVWGRRVAVAVHRAVAAGTAGWIARNGLPPTED